ncbi:hypothetical protein BDD12DRAFT_66654 [Trichophaea hybrida]|nr:hypothetical protein BDD12DRAFT_66654 [Trichophaea hybrida]
MVKIRLLFRTLDRRPRKHCFVVDGGMGVMGVLNCFVTAYLHSDRESHFCTYLCISLPQVSRKKSIHIYLGGVLILVVGCRGIIMLLTYFSAHLQHHQTKV